MIDTSNMDRLIQSAQNKVTELRCILSLIHSETEEAAVIETVDCEEHHIFRCGRCSGIVQYTDNYCAICGTGS